ncbi:MAG: hypothetical protein JXA42_12660 [Anaerolineales bacterium]|nr:hypothetical protein [Anaerolineales bacterium]
MTKKTKRPVFNLPQVLILVGIIVAMALVIGLEARSTASRNLDPDEEVIASRLAMEQERNRQLVLTLTYVHSDDYVADYARNEAGMILPGEVRVVPMFDPPLPTSTPIPPPITAVSAPSTPFEAWWMIFFDSPPPTAD